MIVKLHLFVGSSAGERAHDVRRAPGGSLKSHPVVGGIALTPRYSPGPRIDHIRPAAAPPEEPPDAGPQPDPGPDTSPNTVPAHEAHAEAQIQDTAASVSYAPSHA
ncbi:unnamed protein product [Diatraea saccharalis]|uniref:Uncharacterized protein n=1 Tax=Diatraea saccharalis TaxID=40085 RepID=A0A9N9RFC0_9NEOP|nr:unnamed protein product [Diatraea saccharalis]